jgi:hypothetical protein
MLSIEILIKLFIVPIYNVRHIKKSFPDILDNMDLLPHLYEDISQDLCVTVGYTTNE